MKYRFRTCEVHPEIIEQGSESIVKNGYYDFTALSKDELSTILAVLHNSQSQKYPEKLHGLGLANEAYPIIYKPRYILNEIIVMRYAESKNPYDLLAVAAAFNEKGMMFREKAISYFESYLRKANIIQKHTAKRFFFLAQEPYISHQMSELYEKNYELEKALQYAERAEKFNELAAPAYPIHIGNIYLKINPELCVDYYEKILTSKKYSQYHTLFLNEYQKAVDKRNRGYIYRPREYKPHGRVIKFQAEISDVAKEFLPGGKYYTNIK